MRTFADLLGVVLLGGTGVIAGLGVIRPLAAAPSPAALTVIRWAAGLTMVSAAVVSLVVPVNLLVVIGHAIAVLAAVTLMPRRVGAVAAGLVLTAILIAETSLPLSIVDFTVAPAYLVGAEVALGAVVAVATAAGAARAARARGVAPVTMVAVAVAAGFALSQTLATPHMPDPVQPGVPLMTMADVAGQHLPILVTPNRPGPNLVLVGGEPSEVRVGSDRGGLVAASGRAGVDGTWAMVELPAGQGELWIERHGQRTSVAVDTGHGEPAPPSVAGPDGPECASVALGAALAGRGRPVHACPADALAPSDEADLRATVAFLAGRGVRTLTLATDDSPRSVAAAAAVRDAAARHGLAAGQESGPDGALIVASGWAAAHDTLTAVNARQRAEVVYPHGVYLAPWLLSGPIVAASSGAVIPLRFDPRDEQPTRYQLALDTRFHGQYPTASGYQGWLTATETTDPGGTRLYAASRVAFLPAELSAGHQHGDGGWVPGGTVVPVTGPLDDG